MEVALEACYTTGLVRSLVQSLKVVQDHVVNFLWYSALDWGDGLRDGPYRVELATGRCRRRGRVGRRRRSRGCIVCLIGGDGGGARGDRLDAYAEFFVARGIARDRVGHSRALWSTGNNTHGDETRRASESWRCW